MCINTHTRRLGLGFLYLYKYAFVLILYSFPVSTPIVSPNAAKDFLSAKAQWFPTWGKNGSSAMQVDYVRVYQ